MQKPDSKLLKSITPKLSGLKPWNDKLSPHKKTSIASRKYHHHKNITTTEAVHAAITAEIQLYIFIIYVVKN